MSFHQSRHDKTTETTQYRRTGRSASFNPQRPSSGGYGRGAAAAAGGPAPQRSFKKSNYNAQGGQYQQQQQRVNVPVSGSSASGSSERSNVNNGANVQPQLRGDAPVASGAAKPTEQATTQRSAKPVTKAPTSQPAPVTSDSTAPATPPKTPGDSSKGFPFQFGSISPSVMNVMQVPARTSSAPPNLDEQKREQARHDSTKYVPSLPASLPKSQAPRKDTGAPDQSKNSGEVRPASKVKKDLQSSTVPAISAPTATQMQKPPVLPMSGMSMQMAYPHPQVPVPYGGPSPQIQSQGMSASSLGLHVPVQLQMGNASQLQQQMFLTHMMHQGQSLGYSSQMGQMPHQLSGLGYSPQYTQQQVGKYAGPPPAPRKTPVKITDPKTREELKFDKRGEASSEGGPSGLVLHPNVPPQSQPVASFSPSHPVSYYSNNSYNQNMYFPAPSTSASMNPSSQPLKLNSTVSQATQNVSSMSSSSPRSVAANKAATPVDHSREVDSVASSAASATAQVAEKSAASSTGDKVLKSVSTSNPAVEKDGSPKGPSGEVISTSVKDPKDEKKGQNQSNNNVGGQSTSAASLSTNVPEHVINSRSGTSGSLESRTVLASTITGDSSHASDHLSSHDVSSLLDGNRNHETSKVEERVRFPDGQASYDITFESTSTYQETIEQTRQDLSAENARTRVDESACLPPAETERATDSLINNVSKIDSSSSMKEKMGNNETSVTVSNLSDQLASVSIPDPAGESVEKIGGGQVSLPPSGLKDNTVSELKKPTATKGKKKRKEILQKADAQGTTSDLYVAYKHPEEKKEASESPKSTENTPRFSLKQAPVDAIQGNLPPRDKQEQTKAEPDDWEDAADISSPKLGRSGNKEQVGGGSRDKDDDDEIMRKKYSRDFLLKFAEQCTSLPEGFEIAADIANALMTVNVSSTHLVDRVSYSSPVRVTDKTSGGPDRWNKQFSPINPGRDPRMEIAYGNTAGFRPGGVLRNPRTPTALQFSGGILSGPMHSMGSHGGLQRNGSDADRWQRAANFQQRGLIPSPQTPLQTMHRAERKYEVGKVTDEEQAKQRQLKGILNKLTPQNFEKLFEQVKAVNIDNADTLTGVISQIFDKALMEPTFCEMYANFCFHLSGEMPDFVENNERITFKRLLLNKCQEEFERGEREEEEANKSDEGETKMTEEEREEKRLKVRRRMLGNIRLIGELYKKRMLTEKIMHECIKKLLGQRQTPDEEDIEALCKLMTTIGEMIDHSKAKHHMDSYFERMTMLSNNMQLSSRVRFMLKDVIDLRKNKWQQRRKVEGPKKIEEVHRDAVQERQAQSSRLARGPSMNSSARRVPSVNFGSRGPMLSSPSTQMGGFRGFPTPVRGYGNQDIRLDEKAHFEPRTLSVPLPQRPIGDDPITLGPQGGLARGMASTRGPSSMLSSPVQDFSPSAGDSMRTGPGSNGYSSVSERTLYSTREDLAPRHIDDRFSSPVAYDQSAPQERNRDLRSSDFPTSPAVRGQQPAPVQSIASEKVRSEDQLRDMSLAAIKEFYSARDEKEVALCINDLNSPSFHPSMISLWVTDSFERKDMERDLLAKLLVSLTMSQDSTLSPAQLVKGFELALRTLEDAVTDAPKAPEFLGRIFAKVVEEKVVSLGDIGQLLYLGGEERGSLYKVGLAADVLGSTLEVIKSEKGESVLNEIRASSNLCLVDFRPPGPYKSSKLELFL